MLTALTSTVTGGEVKVDLAKVVALVHEPATTYSAAVTYVYLDGASAAVPVTDSVAAIEALM